MTGHFDPEAETISDEWVGVFLSCGWGYGQTNRDFAQIVRVSDSGRTAFCRRVGAEVVDRPTKTEERVNPTAEHVGPEFGLRVKEARGEPAFRGSYPFIWSELTETAADSGSGGAQAEDREDEPSTRMGTFFPCDGTPQPERQTAPNRGH